MFFEAKKCPSKHHDVPAIHHNLTSKNHLLHPVFLKTPRKNTESPRQKISRYLKNNGQIHRIRPPKKN
jgi:hypothetical protein